MMNYEQFHVFLKFVLELTQLAASASCSLAASEDASSATLVSGLRTKGVTDVNKKNITKGQATKTGCAHEKPRGNQRLKLAGMLLDWENLAAFHSIPCLKNDLYRWFFSILDKKTYNNINILINKNTCLHCSSTDPPFQLFISPASLSLLTFSSWRSCSPAEGCREVPGWNAADTVGWNGSHRFRV